MSSSLIPLLVLVMTTLAGPENPQGDLEALSRAITEQYRAGIQHGSQGHFDQARRELSAVLSIDPTHTSARLRLAMLDDVGSGVIPSATAIHLLRSIQHGLERKWQAAVAECDTSLRLSPTYHEAYRLRGRTWLDLGDYARAIQDYTQAITLNPRGSEAYLNRANARAYTGNLQEAIRDYNLAIQQAPANAEAYNGRGAAFANQSRFAEALGDFDRALELQPTLAPAYLNEASLYESMGRGAKALDLLRALVRNASPQYPALVEEARKRIQALSNP